MHASEWHHTTMDEKLDYLIRAIESGKVTLDEMIQGYKKFYTLEVANKAYVLQSLDKSVAKIKAYALTQGYELK
jgi:hypothetical protein